MLADHLAQRLADLAASDAFSGVVSIRRGDERVFEGAYGEASRSWHIPNTVNTRFRLASVGKLFTAVAVFQLIERGLLALDRSIVDILDLHDTAIPRDVSIQHLLLMTGGIADWFEESGDWDETWTRLCREHPIFLLRDNNDFLPTFANKPPLAAAGARHQYSNSSYILLGMAIERASGIPYFDYVRQHVFAPAGMEHADFVALDDIVSDVAEGYVPVADTSGTTIGWKKNIYLATPTAAADGGATASAEDLHRFMAALRGQALLGPERSQAMLMPQGFDSDLEDRPYRSMYGYGSYFLVDADDRLVRLSRPGEEAGISCRLYYYPAQGLDIVILGNLTECAGPLGWVIHDLLQEH
jgi:CubicO group peptidase (beta-lactamase class C family)